MYSEILKDRQDLQMQLLTLKAKAATASIF